MISLLDFEGLGEEGCWKLKGMKCTGMPKCPSRRLLFPLLTCRVRGLLPLQRRKGRDPKQWLGSPIKAACLETGAQHKGHTGQNGSTRDKRQLLVQVRMPAMWVESRNKRAVLWELPIPFWKWGPVKNWAALPCSYFLVNKLIKP